MTTWYFLLFWRGYCEALKPRIVSVFWSEYTNILGQEWTFYDFSLMDFNWHRYPNTRDRKKDGLKWLFFTFLTLLNTKSKKNLKWSFVCLPGVPNRNWIDFEFSSFLTFDLNADNQKIIRATVGWHKKYLSHFIFNQIIILFSCWYLMSSMWD